MVNTSEAVKCADPEISVVIPHYQDLAHLDECLAALTKQSGLQNRAFEIVVADNNSACGIEEVRRVAGNRARVILATEQGAGPARNAGVAEARGTHLAFTDSDCVPHPEWLMHGIKALDRFDLVGGRVITSVSCPQSMTGVEAFERVFAFDFKTYIEKKGFTGSGNLFCLKTTFDQVGPFKTVVSEDREWSIRATGMGLRLGYEPKAVVEHPARESWQELIGKWRRINRETYAFERHRGMSKAKWIGRTWLLPASILPHTIKAMRSPALSRPTDRMKSVAVLARHRLWRFFDAHKLMFERLN